MAKDPVDRYQSADALQADLNQVHEIVRAEASESFRLGCLDRRFRTTRYQVASPAYVTHDTGVMGNYAARGGVLVVNGRAGQGRTTGIMGLLEPLPTWGSDSDGRETKRDRILIWHEDAVDSLLLTQYRDGLLTSQTVVNDLLSDIENGA